MNDDLIKQNRDVIKGSVYDVATSKGVKPEDVLAEADVVVMIDISSSMTDRTNDGRTRFDKAVDALTDIQKSFPGRVVLISFADGAKMELSGMPTRPSGMTNIKGALEIAKNFDGMDTKFYLISDGEPNCGPDSDIFDLAATFEDPINCIFIGEDRDLDGIAFMKELAKLTGGIDSGRIEPSMLGDTIKLLITGNQNG